MADETNATSNNDTPAGNAPKEKKTRGPRKSKIVSEAAVSPSVSAPAKKTRGRAKRSEQAPVASAPAPVAEKKVATGKVATKPQLVKRGSRKAQALTPSSDGFSELLKLEEENQKLRKTLSDKLRAENADLRKKLGIA